MRQLLFLHTQILPKNLNQNRSRERNSVEHNSVPNSFVRQWDRVCLQVNLFLDKNPKIFDG